MRSKKPSIVMILLVGISFCLYACKENGEDFIPSEVIIGTWQSGVTEYIACNDSSENRFENCPNRTCEECQAKYAACLSYEFKEDGKLTVWNPLVPNTEGEYSINVDEIMLIFGDSIKVYEYEFVNTTELNSTSILADCKAVNTFYKLIKD